MSLRAQIKQKLGEEFQNHRETNSGFKINIDRVSMDQIRNLAEVADLGNINIQIGRSGTGVVIIVE